MQQKYVILKYKKAFDYNFSGVVLDGINGPTNYYFQVF